ncbi:hypothetical protein HH110_08935 [Stenotrophomonas sp. SAM-B]|uniref:phage tail tube protein n=1 Tax=Stenotrophomonas sp. SAM-B TaxID=2729141 RepID=UPI0015A0D51D|nr:hypothetical protein [Stenotrophomonas sp. SAM-B]NWF33170.1 hypothetical protein [Stenotrophomonas sp. SAM-B]
MAQQPKVRKFAGDLRFFEYGAGANLVPVIPDSDDKFGNKPLEQSSLTFSYEAGDTTEVKSKRRDDRYGQIIHTDANPGTTGISVTALEVPPAILARMLYGSAVSSSVQAGEVEDRPLAVYSKDVPVDLGHRFVLASPVPVVKKGSTTLVAGTDYDIDNRQGLFIPLAGGSIVHGDALTVSYSFDGYLETAINGGAVPNKSFMILGNLQDRISGEDGLLRIPQVDLTVDGDVDWFSDEPIQVTLTGSVIFRSEETALYTFKVYEQKAS